MTDQQKPDHFNYTRWRHGGWYVTNIHYPSGACGCISNNYTDKKWRIACDERPFEQQPTFRTRDEAARAEWQLIQDMAAARTAVVAPFKDSECPSP